MKKFNNNTIRLVLIFAVSLTLFACAANNPRFTAETPAGFWSGLWHGIISIFTLIIGFFTDKVRIYELHNAGGWYDFGFMLGIMIFWGGSGSQVKGKTKKKCQKDKEWEEIADKIEKKVMRKMKEWSESEEDADWEEVGKKAEQKIKRKIREWAEKE